MIRLDGAPEIEGFDKLIPDHWYRVRMVARAWGEPDEGDEGRLSPQIGDEFPVLAVFSNPDEKAAFSGEQQFVWACCTANPSDGQKYRNFPQVEVVKYLGPEKPVYVHQPYEETS